jgi:putative flippase GtrA
MNALVRWGKFNLVGAMGMVVQLGALALLNRLAPAHYLVTTAIAVEVTLLHNFVWHMHYTWKDRRQRSAWTQLVRFHLANGIAILCCSVLNFLLGNTWAFAPAPRPMKRSRS